MQSTVQILFGPSHDARHIDPDTPNGYEWWYFDAVSDDGKFTLVVIFFLGTPMSPYYKTVVDGKNPLPKDWCGVFVSLHEREGRGLSATPWRERAYAYNLYRGGEFATDAPAVKIGNSAMRSEVVDGQWRWRLTLDEPGLWRGRTQAELTFTLAGEPLALPSVAETGAVAGGASDHHWACAAPRCRVEGFMANAGGRVVSFGGTGYHDHNFGMLPWRDAAFWFWSRVHIESETDIETAVFYRTVPLSPDLAEQSVVLLFDDTGQMLDDASGLIEPLAKERNAYGFRHESRWRWQTANGFTGTIGLLSEKGGVISEGPFYRRIQSLLTQENVIGLPQRDSGVGEVFQPSRLCGPIASRAMWTRMRRRS